MHWHDQGFLQVLVAPRAGAPRVALQPQRRVSGILPAHVDLQLQRSLVALQHAYKRRTIGAGQQPRRLAQRLHLPHQRRVGGDVVHGLS
ncbi:MAG TPA: hypothetical protein DDX20_01855, partial [Stenotrophomonas sp.]|nr:hypothetical protein [Stenotrophomonas sp.]